MRSKYTMTHLLKAEIKFTACKITELYGLIIKGDKLAKLVGFNTNDALRMALKQGRCDLPVTVIKGQGLAATAYEVAEYVINVRRQTI